MDYLLDLILIPMQVIIVIYTVYYFVLAVIGMWRSRVHKNYTPKNSFAIVVCAHNEEAVVGELVKNLKSLDYPDELYDIFVVADNCTDKTAEVASAAGANVHERFNKEEVGKGYAMGWMFDRVDQMDRKYDAFLIFDADNLVHPQFMLEMNDHLEKGESVIQGYLNSKNPTDSWVAGTFSIMFWMVNHMWHLAKYRIGLSTALGGTGMCIRTSIIKEYGWDCTSLTEDMEFSMKLLTHGLKTTWAHDAIVYDEKVTTMMASCKQRLRWAQGQFDVGNRFIPKMFKAGWKHKDIRMWDSCIYLMQPHFLMISTIFIIISYVQLAFPPFYTNIYTFLPSQMMTAIMMGQYILPMIILAKIRVKWKAWLYLLLYPVFIYSWIPIIFLGFIHRNDHEWSHTKHTRAMSMDDIVGNVKNTTTIK